MRTTTFGGLQASAALRWLFVVFLLLLVQLSTAWAADESAAPGQAVYLQYREAPQPLMNWAIPVGTEPKPFQKEPDFAGRKVCRSNFQLGPPSVPATGYIWDYKQGRLYLDLNHDRDLTDDPSGVFLCPASHLSYYYQTFTNVHLSIKTPAGEYPFCCDLNLYNPEGGRPSLNISCRSFWEGKLSLQGRDWQAGIIASDAANLGAGDHGYLLLRSWDQRAQPINVQNGSLDAFSFAPNLFFGTQAYRVDCSLVQQDGAPKYKLSFREKEAELGEIKLTGKFIERLVIASAQTGQPGKPQKKSPGQPAPAAYTIVLDRPEPTVKVPVGEYQQCQVVLKAGTARAYKDARYATAQTAIEIVANNANPPVLTAGGPLTNSVSAQRQGNNLSLQYQLVGADSASYQLTSQDRTHPPAFSIYKNGKSIHSGKFEFG